MERCNRATEWIDDKRLGDDAMSLINQVLKDLDKRGASTQIGEATIRVVHARSGSSAFLLIVAGAASMLGVGAVAWLVWGGQQRQPAPPPVIAAVPMQPSAVQLAASQPLVAGLQNTVPLIESVSPNPVMATGAAQLLTINGSHFANSATVMLRNAKGQAYPNRPVLEQSSSQLVIKPYFGRKSGSWMVEVINADDSSSEPYSFTVQAPVVAKAPPSESAVPPTQHNKARALMPAPTTVLPAGVNKQPTQTSVQQQAENEFRRAYQLMRKGRNTEALAGYEAALKLYPGHEQARQTMVSLLLEKKRNADAERALQEGLEINPQQSSFAMLLARLQVEHDALPQALDTLLKTLPYAEKQPDYQAFVAALLQRQNRHAEAVEHYQKALQIKPQSGVWLMGMGISLRAEQRNTEAREVFKRALDSNTLNAELQAYVTQQLKEL